MKRKWIVAIAIYVGLIAVCLVAIYVIPSVRGMLEKTYIAEYGSIDVKDEVSAFIVRDETVYYAKSDGVVYNIATDGDRVAQDEAISTIYDGEANSGALKKLHTLDMKINTLKEQATDSKLYNTDSDSTESEIAAKMETISELAATNSVSEINAIKTEINNIRKNATTSKE